MRKRNYPNDDIRNVLEQVLVHAKENRRGTERAVGELGKIVAGLCREITALNSETAKLKAQMAEHTQRYNAMQTAIVKTLTFQFELLAEPDARAHAEAVVRDFQKHKGGHNEIDG